MVLGLQIAFAVLAFVLLFVISFALVLTLGIVLVDYFRERKTKKLNNLQKQDKRKEI